MASQFRIILAALVNTILGHPLTVKEYAVYNHIGKISVQEAGRGTDPSLEPMMERRRNKI
jgi:hypothetical protein